LRIIDEVYLLIMSADRVVVLGANGFVGRIVAEHLVAAGFAVDGVVRNREYQAIPAVRLVCLSEPSRHTALRPVLEGAYAVINAAGRAHVLSENQRDPLTAFRQVNVELAQSVAMAASRAGVSVYVEISSVAAVCERATSVVTSSTVPAPTSPYGISKLEAEDAAFSASSALRVAVLRSPMIYGAGMRGNPLRLFDLIARRVPLPLALVDNRRSMMFAGNLAAAIRAVISHGTATGRYFVADSETISTRRFVNTASKALGISPRLFPVPLPFLKAAGSIGDALQPFWRSPLTSNVVDRLTSSFVVDTSDFERDFAFVPPVSFDDGVHETASWYVDQRKAV
jgi:UDP-glucose 4-epimerase